MYRVFVRNWWKHNPRWPNGLEPDAGAQESTLGHVVIEEEAREIAMEYNRTHEPGELFRKAEYRKE